MKVYAVFDTETNNRASKWYERMGDARRRSNELNKWKDKYEAKECHISFNEPKTLNIPKLEDFRICSVKIGRASCRERVFRAV